jgi:hypothetical protein
MTGRLALGGLLVLLQLPPGTVQPRPGHSPRLTVSQFVAQLERLAAAIETSDATLHAPLRSGFTSAGCGSRRRDMR